MNRTFPPKRPGEKRIASVDFAPELPDGVTVSSVEPWQISVHRGYDANPSDVLSGSPSQAGTEALHMLIGGVTGTMYRIVAVATLSDTQRIEIPVLLPVSDLF